MIVREAGKEDITGVLEFSTEWSGTGLYAVMPGAYGAAGAGLWFGHHAEIEILPDPKSKGELLMGRICALEDLFLHASELWEVACLRGDNVLPHPCDDPKLWTARMQTAWEELGIALAALDGLSAEAEEKHGTR